MPAAPLHPYEPERFRLLQSILIWTIGLALFAATIWFVYTQMTATGIGITAPAPTPQEVNLLPPPPPPPPPPEVKEKPPEPTETPQPTPAEAAKTPAQQAAPVSMDTQAQAGTDSYGVKSGNGNGAGNPASTGTCFGTQCGTSSGMTVGRYSTYLSSTLQDRVQDDKRLGRLIFSAEVSFSISRQGCVTGVKLRNSTGGSDADMQKLVSLLGGVCGLDTPPEGMVFPQVVTIRGRKSSF